MAIVRADRVIGGMLARVKAVPDGGFLLEEGEGKACGPRSRCVHVLWMSPDRVGPGPLDGGRPRQAVDRLPRTTRRRMNVATSEEVSR